MTNVAHAEQVRVEVFDANPENNSSLIPIYSSGFFPHTNVHDISETAGWICGETYYVRVTASNICHTKADVEPLIIGCSVPLPQVSVSSVFCPGTGFGIDPTASTDYTEYALSILQGNSTTWSTGWQQGIASIQLISPTLLSCGSYDVKLELKNHCEESASTTVGISSDCPDPVAAFTIPANVCNNGPISIDGAGAANVFSFQYDITEVDGNNAIVSSGFSWVSSWQSNTGLSGSLGDIQINASARIKCNKRFRVRLFTRNRCDEQDIHTAYFNVLCSPQLSAVESDPTPNPASVHVFPCCDGAIDITVSGGLPTYAYQWCQDIPNVGLNPISTAEDVINLCDGYYKVIVTDANGCTVEGNYDLFCDLGGSGSGTNKKETELTVGPDDGVNQLIIFPNPSKGALHAELADENVTIVSATVLDLQGKIVFRIPLSEIEDSKLDINLPQSINSGVYFLSLGTSTGEYKGRFVLE